MTWPRRSRGRTWVRFPERGYAGTTIEAIVRNGPLRGGMGSAEAAEPVWVLTSAEVYRLFAVDRSWAPERYETWLAETLEALLLP